MDSFYGGHQGQSFVIKHRFESVADMVNAFIQGSIYHDVWYGEYCIIDTPNKNNPDNGKIYKRGANSGKFDTNARTAISAALSAGNNTQAAKLADAIYIGQIVGPSSGTPIFEFTAINDIASKASEDLNGEINEELYYPIDGGLTTHRDKNVGYNEEENGIVVLSSGDNGIELIPGKEIIPGQDGDPDTDKYNDKIQWTWCNVRTQDNDTTSTFKIGFKIPYTVFEAEAKGISPYAESAEDNLYRYSDTAHVERQNPTNHPFYYKYRYSIPQGLHGVNYSNFGIYHFINNTTIDLYTPDQFSIEIGEDGRQYVKVSGDGPGKRFQSDDAIGTFLAVRISAYDDYRDPVSSVKADNGFLVWDPEVAKIEEQTSPTTDPDQQDPSEQVDDNVDPDTPNEGNENEQESSEENVVYKYANEDNKDVVSGRLNSAWVYLGDWKTITDISLTGDGIFNINYSTGDFYSPDVRIRWIDKITYDEKTGNISVQYNIPSNSDDAIDEEGNIRRESVDLGPINSILRVTTKKISQNGDVEDEGSSGDINSMKHLLILFTISPTFNDESQTQPDEPGDTPSEESGEVSAPEDGTIKVDVEGNRYIYLVNANNELYTGWYRDMGEIALYSVDEGTIDLGASMAVQNIDYTQQNYLNTLKENTVFLNLHTPGVIAGYQTINKGIPTVISWWDSATTSTSTIDTSSV